MPDLKFVIHLTNNQYAAENTNMVKLHALLDRTRNDQIAYYQTGIGTSLHRGCGTTYTAGLLPAWTSPWPGCFENM